jgi:hypothetical protein
MVRKRYLFINWQKIPTKYLVQSEILSGGNTYKIVGMRSYPTQRRYLPKYCSWYEILPGGHTYQNSWYEILPGGDTYQIVGMRSYSEEIPTN